MILRKTQMMIPRKCEGGPIMKIKVDDLAEHAKWAWREVPVILGRPTSKTLKGTPYKTYSVAVLVGDDFEENSIARQRLSQCVNGQLVEAAATGRVVLRSGPDYQAYEDETTGNKYLRVYMRYVVE